MKHKKTISIVLAICMMLTVVPMFGTTAFAASTTLAVGTDSNDAIVNALKTAANNEVVTLGGDGTVTLAAGDTVNCLVVFAPDTGKTITVDGGTFTAQNSIIQVSCADITGAVVLKNGTYTRTALCASGSLVLDNTAFSSENCCIDIVNATVDVGLINGSTLTATGNLTKTIRVNGNANVRNLFINEGCKVTGGYSCIDVTGNTAATIQNISVSGELTNSNDNRYAIDLGSKAIINNAITVNETGVVQSYGNNGVAINSYGKIGTLEVKGVILGERIGVGVFSGGVELSEIANLKVTGRIIGSGNSIAVFPNDPTLCNIGASSFDVNSGILSKKTDIHSIGSTGVGEYEMNLVSAWGSGDHFVAQVTWGNDNLPLAGAKVFLYNQTDGAKVPGDVTTDAEGLAKLNFTPQPGKQYSVMTNAFYDTVHGLLFSSASATPVFAANSINIGDYALIGKYNDEPVLWRCVNIDENGPLMLADRIISIKAFDAAGLHLNDTNGQRVNHGSNLWSASNIRTWLNSTDDSILWPCGNSPDPGHIYNGHNPYYAEKGFLANGNFTADERALIKQVSQTNMLGVTDVPGMVLPNHLFQYNSDLANGLQNYFTAYAETVQDGVFLLDFRQAYNIYKNSSVLGGNYLKAYPTQKAVDASGYKVAAVDPSIYLSYWLRTPHTGTTGAEVRRVDAAGLIDTEFANHGDVYGIRPAFYLNLQNAAFTGDGTFATPYSLPANQVGNHTVSYNANGGNGTMASATVANGGNYTVLPMAFTRSGYSFVNWNTQSNGSGTTYGPNATINNVTSDITLYAQWSYNGGNGGGSGGGGGGSTETTTVYQFTKGADGKYVIGSKDGLTFICDGPYNKFSGILVDGASQPKTNYTYKEGSTIVTLKPEYLQTLAEGKHTLRLVYTNGYTDTTFTVSKHANPQTSVWENPFTDVKDTDWFYNNVGYVYQKGIMKGVSTILFASEQNTTRGMLATMLYRLEENPTAGKCPFDDVAKGSWYESAITWAAENKLANGYGVDKNDKNNFGPNDILTREQIVVILYNYAKLKGMDASGAADLAAFTDAAKVSAYAVPAMKWAVKTGIMQGIGADLLSPASGTTRGQMAAIFERFMELNAK